MFFLFLFLRRNIDVQREKVGRVVLLFDRLQTLVFRRAECVPDAILLIAAQKIIRSFARVNFSQGIERRSGDAGRVLRAACLSRATRDGERTAILNGDMMRNRKDSPSAPPNCCNSIKPIGGSHSPAIFVIPSITPSFNSRKNSKLMNVGAPDKLEASSNCDISEYGRKSKSSMTGVLKSRICW